MAEHLIIDAATASQVIHAYEAVPGIMVLGCLSDGVTVYKQQVRALNLAAALVQRAVASKKPLGRVAVIGGGIGGLTLVAGLLVLADAKCEITLFEKRWDLCPLQQGSDTRWLHPRIYDWPVFGSRNPAAGLPVLDWSEGRASDVARTILTRFSDYCEYARSRAGPSLNVYLGLNHLSVNPLNSRVEWMGHQGIHKGGHFHIGDPSGDTKNFDVIVAATGFGLEGDIPAPASRNSSYWRNDTLGQPALGGTRQMYVISGHGDGGVIDLCRITIERFRQDTILEEIFGRSLDDLEDALRKLTGGRGGRLPENVKTMLDGADANLQSHIREGIDRLRGRLRKDSRAILHVRPQDPIRHSIDALFDDRSSFLNRYLLYLLYKAGGLAVRFDDLERVIAESGAAPTNVVRRHGTRKMQDLMGIFSDPGGMAGHLTALERRNDQSARRLWPLGVFPYVGKDIP